METESVWVCISWCQRDRCGEAFDTEQEAVAWRCGWCVRHHHIVEFVFDP